jgi:hypothetical protein
MENMGSFAANSGSTATKSAEDGDDECIETKGKHFDAVGFRSFPRFYVVILLAVGRKFAPILFYCFLVSSRFDCSRYLYFISFGLMLLLRARVITRSVLSISNFVGKHISSKNLDGSQNLVDVRAVGSRKPKKG